MIITLIGFSGAGKSYWSNRLVTEKSFSTTCCDSEIEEKLKKHLGSFPGDGIHAVADWMGQPYEDSFNERQNLYLDFEKEVMQEVIEHAPQVEDKNKNYVIDTSGSVIYLDASVFSQIKKFSKVVYLEITSHEYQLMLERYINNPKPVVWGDKFTKRSWETKKEALARSFVDLIKYRKSLYEKYADITLSFDQHAERMLSCDDFLSLVY